MSITTALKARREALRDREAGFTLIELLVVVIIIGILAAVAIPIYIGVTNNAKDSAAKSDLNSDRTAIVGYGTDNNGTLPASGSTSSALATSLSKYGWSLSSGNTFGTYTAPTSGTNAGLFCLTIQSATGNWFAVTTNNSVAAVSGNTNSCPASY